jgi:nitrate reductase NapA
MSESNIPRREFLKFSAKMAALTALGASGSFGSVAHALEQDPSGLKWHKAPCRFCGTGCGVLVGVKKGRVVAVQGDRQAPVNKGLLCAKGYHAGAALYGKDRLTHPMIRKNGKLENVSWDEAIELIAKKSNSRSEQVFDLWFRAVDVDGRLYGNEIFKRWSQK